MMMFLLFLKLFSTFLLLVSTNLIQLLPLIIRALYYHMLVTEISIIYDVTSLISIFYKTLTHELSTLISLPKFIGKHQISKFEI